MILLIVAQCSLVLLSAISIHGIKAALTEQVGHTASLGDWVSKSRLCTPLFASLQIWKCVCRGYFTKPTSCSSFFPEQKAHGKQAQQAWMVQICELHNSATSKHQVSCICISRTKPARAFLTQDEPSCPSSPLLPPPHKAEVVTAL